ncbi:hypothetical protein [Cardiobacterium hominis]
MSTSNQAIASAFNAATGMGGSSMTGMLSFGTLALIIVFFTASALLALGMMMRNGNRQSGMDSWFQLLFILCGISLILLFFSLL